MLEELIISALFILFGLVLLYASFRYYKMRQIMKDAPTSNIRSVSVGLAEIKGTVDSIGKTIRHPLKQRDCLAYKLKIEEYEPDDDGSNWELVKDKEEEVDFKVRDDTGEILVKPEGCEYNFREPDTSIFSDDEDDDIGDSYIRIETRSPDEDLKIDEDVDNELLDFEPLIGSEKYRITIKSLYPGDSIYVLGDAKPKRDGEGDSINENNLYVGDTDSKAPFVIANYEDESKLRKSVRNKMVLSLIFGFSALSLGLYVLFDILQ
jgi:hypothetical protein